MRGFHSDQFIFRIFVFYFYYFWRCRRQSTLYFVPINVTYIEHSQYYFVSRVGDFEIG